MNQYWFNYIFALICAFVHAVKYRFRNIYELSNSHATNFVNFYIFWIFVSRFKNQPKSLINFPRCDIADLPQNGGCFISSAPLGPEVKTPKVKKTEESQEKPVTSPIKIATNGKSSNERTFMETKIIEKVAKNKPSFMEKVSQRASALNLTRLSSNLVLATGSSTLRKGSFSNLLSTFEVIRYH